MYKHLPLSAIHPRAERAAEASECAADQHVFWEYHNVFFENQEDLSEAALSRYATQVGANLDAFGKCVSGRQTKVRIDSDLEKGREHNVSSTPTLFVNGRKLEGAQTYEVLVHMIMGGPRNR